jgi:hypothetical protein
MKENNDEKSNLRGNTDFGGMYSNGKPVGG